MGDIHFPYQIKTLQLITFDNMIFIQIAFRVRDLQQIKELISIRITDLFHFSFCIVFLLEIFFEVLAEFCITKLINFREPTS